MLNCSHSFQVLRQCPDVTHKATRELPPSVADEAENENSADDPTSSSTAFQQCRRFFDQLGLASWEQRQNVHLVKKDEKFLRELKNLDGKR